MVSVTYKPFIPNVIMLTECHILAPYAQCHYDDCHYAKCHYAECRGAWSSQTKITLVLPHLVKRHSA
jgi:hypothetical protein